MNRWLVIGLSGVTCGGKTSLAIKLKHLLTRHFNSQERHVDILMISQDDFFLKPDDSRHVFLPSLGHNNWELPSAVDLGKMYETALGIISSCKDDNNRGAMTDHGLKSDDNSHNSKSKSLLKGILLIEGFLVLNHVPTRSLCHLGYYLLLSRSVCQSRRSCRTYDPPDIPGYFEQVVWPEHVYRRREVIGEGKLVDLSDPLTMQELKKSSSEEGKSAIDCGNTVQNECVDEDPRISSQTKEKTKKLESYTMEQSESLPHGDGKTQSSVLEEGCSETKNGGTLKMNFDKDVQPLEGFKQAGLGLVNEVRVLDGGVISVEEMAELVFHDVMKALNNLMFE